MKNYRYLSGNVLIFNHSRQIETLEFFFSSWSFAWFLRFIKISRALRQQNKNHKPRDGNGGTSHEGRTEGRTKGVRYGHYYISGWCLALVTSFGTDNLFSSWELSFFFLCRGMSCLFRVTLLSAYLAVYWLGIVRQGGVERGGAFRVPACS
jgi:hypothetical protein